MHAGYIEVELLEARAHAVHVNVRVHDSDVLCSRSSDDVFQCCGLKDA
jgi:hypothetical protein